MQFIARRASLFFLAVVALILLSVAPAFANAVSGTVHGGNYELRGAGVRLESVQFYSPHQYDSPYYDSTYTDANGAFSFPDYFSRMYNGTYRLTVIPNADTGFDSATIDIVVNGAEATHNFVLVPSGSQISGSVRTPGGAGVSDAYVYVNDMVSGVEAGGEWVDRNGNYSIHVDSGTYKMTLGCGRDMSNMALPKYLYGNEIVQNLAVTGPTTHDFVLPLVTLSGTLTDWKGAPVENVAIQAWGSRIVNGNFGYYNLNDEATSDASGHYSLTLIAGKGYELTLTPPEGSDLVQKWVSGVDAPNNTVQNFVLTPAITLSGTVRTPGGVGVSNLNILVHDIADGAQVGWAVTDGDGHYSIPLPGGTYKMSLNYSGAPSNVPLPPWLNGIGIVQNLAVNAPTTQDIVLPLVTLSGKTTDRNGTPVGNVAINVGEHTVYGDVGYYSISAQQVTSDASGHYSLPLLADMDYSLTLTPPEGSGLAQIVVTGIDVSTDTTKDLALTAGITLSGTVRTPHGVGVSNVDVVVYDMTNGALSWETVTDGDGHYSIPLPGGTYSMTLYHFDGPSSNVPLPTMWSGINIVQNLMVKAATTQDIVLPLVTLDGWATDDKGAPVGNVAISAAGNEIEIGNGGSYYIIEDETTSDASGHYSLPLFAGSGYSLTIVPPDELGLDETVVDDLDMTRDRSLDIVFKYLPLLTVTKSGIGSGTVISVNDSAINCGSTCSDHYPSGTMVSLSAAPDSGSSFDGWSGCDNVSGTSCSVTIYEARTVTATFTMLKPAISGTPAASVIAGSAYIFVPTAVRADSFSISNKPAWANFDTGNGALTGTPTNANAGSYPNIVISATNGAGTASLPAFSITVVALPKPTISGTPAASVTAWSAYGFTPTATKANSFSISNKPSWASFDTGTGALTGTPTNANAGIYSNIVISASNIAGTTSLPAFTITVVALPKPTISGSPTTKATTGTNYGFTPTATKATNFSISNKPSWAAFNTATGALTGAPSSADAGIYPNIVISASNFAGTVSLPAFSITVALPMPTISGTPATKVIAGNAYSFIPTATNATSFSITNKPAWATFDTSSGALTGTPASTNVGTFSYITIKATNSTGSATLPAFSIAVVPPMPTISGSPATSATTGQSYSFIPTATSATSFSITNKPAWATFNTVTGALTGTPATTAVGTYSNIAIKATNVTGSATLPAFSIAVTLAMPTIKGTPAGTVTTGQAYSFVPTATSATSFSISNKPSWATFNTTTGALTGTPAKANAGSYQDIVISANNSTGTASLAPFSITVALPMPTISGAPATKVTAGITYSFKPTALNATGFSIANKPSWASFNTATGALTGIPVNSDAGSYANIVISASNSTGSVSLPAFTITVAMPLPTISGIPVTKATAGTAYSFTPKSTNATSFSITNKPVWASFDTVTGALIGTPAKANVGTYSSIVIKASNSTGSASLLAFSITVALPMPTISGTPATTVVAGNSYSFVPTASNATSFSIANKPAWATFNTATGALTGTPSSSNVGTFANISIKAINTSGTASLPVFTITVTAAAPTRLLGGAIQGRQLNLAYTISNFAGTMGTTGATDGIGAAASFYNPMDITTDGKFLYVTDSYNCAIRKIEIATGAVTTVAGKVGVSSTVDGIGTSASFSFPQGITTDGTNLYVVDSAYAPLSGNYTIRKIVISTGAVTTIAGTPGVAGSNDGTGAAAQFNGPTGITTDGTNLYVVDSGNNTIRKIVISTGTVTTIAGTAGVTGSNDGTGKDASFNYPNGLTTDGTNLYVTDTYNDTIRKIVLSTGAVTTLAGTGGISGSTDGTGAGARLNWPSFITTDGTYLYVTDGRHTANILRKISLSGTVTTVIGAATPVGHGDFSTGITTDGKNLYIVDGAGIDNRIIKIN